MICDSREEIHIYCIACCRKCLVDTLAEQQKINCQVCTSPLEYHCTLCDKQFSNLAKVRSHVIEGLGQMSTLFRCAKCYRSEFSTRCSFIKHQRLCNTPHCFDKEIVLRLERCHFQSNLLKDIKPIPLLPISTKKSQSADSIKTDNNFPHVYDHLEIEEEFKTSFTITDSTSDFYSQRADSREKISQPLHKVNKNRNMKIQHDKHQRHGHINAKNSSRNLDATKRNKCKKTFSQNDYLLSHSKIRGQPKNWKRSLLFCDHCNHECFFKGNLRKHIQAKHLPPNFNANKCSKCEKSFTQPSGLFKHSRICGQSEEKKKSFMLSCDNCNYKTVTKASLAGHIQAKHLSRDFNANKCSKCEKSFSLRSSLLRHSKICGKPKDVIRSLSRFTCDICDFKFKEKSTLKRHIQTKHLPRDLSANKCSKCKKTFTQRSNLQRHSIICGKSAEVMRSFMLSCDHCNHKTVTKTSLASHIKAKHLPRNPYDNKCSKCNKSFSQRSTLLAHSRICGQPKSVVRSLMITCNQCNYKTTLKSSLTAHIKAKHLPRDFNANKCSKCNKIYSSRSHLTRHSKICGRPKDFVHPSMLNCDYCNYKTFEKASLTSHIQAKHLPRDPNAYKCTKCEKTFNNKSTFSNHSKICHQSEEKLRSLMLSCDHCSYETVWRKQLINHIQAKHLPRAKCKNCKKSFAWRANLFRHSKICGKSKNQIRLLRHYACDHCHFKSIDKGSLVRHIQAKHLKKK